jgi:hypothetical protein
MACVKGNPHGAQAVQKAMMMFRAERAKQM